MALGGRDGGAEAAARYRQYEYKAVRSLVPRLGPRARRARRETRDARAGGGGSRGERRDRRERGDDAMRRAQGAA